MKCRIAIQALLVGSLLNMAAAGWAQNIASGVYAMPDSGYSIAIQPTGNDLDVTEAGTVRRYVGQGDGSYRYTSDTTGATYELRFRDRGTITALKLGSGNAPTALIRQGGPAPVETPLPVAAAPAPAPAPAAPPAATAGERPDLKIAEKYQALALTDKKDVQTWAFCSAAALKRSMATKTEADAYGREAAERLKLIMVDPAATPCPDAIPENLWTVADANQEALKQANADQLNAASKQAAEIAAMREKQAAEQRAFEQAKAAHQAAVEKSRQEQEAFAKQQAAYQAALAEHRRQVEELARKSGGQ